MDWSAESFPHFKTPNKKSRERTESETSSNTDFNTVGGIAAILRGKLVPSSSYVSPKSGMIRTPEATPGKDKLVKPEDKANEVHYSVFTVKFVTGGVELLRGHCTDIPADQGSYWVICAICSF